MDILTDRRQKGWFWDSNEIFDAGLSTIAIIVRLFLARCADINGQCFPSTNTIAKKCNVSRASVFNALAELEGKGWLKREQRTKNNAQTTNIYTLLMPQEECIEADPGLPGLSDRPVQEVDGGSLRDRRGGSTSCTGGVYQVDTEGLPTEGLPTEGLPTEGLPNKECPAPPGADDNKHKPSCKNRIKYPEDTTAFKLAYLLREKILERDSNTKVPENTIESLQSWAREADRMIRLDKRDPTEALEIIGWCQQNSFWSANILSMSSFRKQYDRLKRQRETDVCRGGTDYGRSDSASKKPKTNKYAHLYK